MDGGVGAHGEGGAEGFGGLWGADGYYFYGFDGVFQTFAQADGFFDGWRDGRWGVSG